MKVVDFKRPDKKSLNIEIIRYCPEDITRNKTPNRHRHNFHSLHFISNGKSEQEVDFCDFVLEKQHIMLIPKDSVHWEKTHHNVEGFTILFKDDFFSSHQNLLLQGLMHYATMHRKLLIPIANTKPITHYFELLMFEQHNDINQNQVFILQNIMLALLNHIEFLIVAPKSIPSFLEYRVHYQRLITLIENHYTNQGKQLAFYAEALGVTKRKLNDVAMHITGKTTSDIINERIILEAKRYLCFNDMSIKEIAFSLGYSDQYYFSRIFKAKTQTTPKQFRMLFAK